MNSEIELCNMVMTHLGKNTVYSLTDNCEEARRFAGVYPHLRDEVLASADWNCARQIELLEESDQEIPGWTKSYRIPAGCLKVRKVFTDASTKERPSIDFEIVGSLIGTDGENAYAQFTGRLKEVSDFDLFLKNAMVYRCASVLAKPLTGDDALAERMQQNFLIWKSEGSRINASGTRIEKTRKSATVTSR